MSARKTLGSFVAASALLLPMPSHAGDKTAPVDIEAVKLRTVLAGPCKDELTALKGAMIPKPEDFDLSEAVSGKNAQQAAKALVTCERRNGATPPAGLLKMAGQEPN